MCSVYFIIMCMYMHIYIYTAERMSERGRKTIAALCCIRRQTYLHAPRPLQSLPPLPLPTAITRSYVSSDLSKLEIDVGGVAEEGG